MARPWQMRTLAGRDAMFVMMSTMVRVNWKEMLGAIAAKMKRKV